MRKCSQVPVISAAGRSAPCRLVVFDKDGTLIDFNQIWWGRLERAVAALAARASLTPASTALIFRTLGADMATRTIRPETPYAVSTIAKIGTIVATLLYQDGRGWHEAEALVRDTLEAELLAPPSAAEIKPLADLPRLFGSLRAAGMKIVIATSDDRRGTEATVAILGLAGLVDRLVCADDPGPRKPEPALMTQIAADLGIPIAETAIVSDSMNDMLMGKRAGAGFAIGVLSGTTRRHDLEGAADAIIGTVGEIVIGAH